MNADDWDAISILLDKGFKWREPFGEIQAGVYQVLLEGYSADQVMTAVRALVASGQVFGPTPGELVSQIRTDPSTPTFDEAYQQLYGPGGVFGFKRRGVTISPWVEAFVANYGRDRLRLLEVDHDEYGDVKRRELRQSYEQFLEASEGRELAAIAEGRRGGGLRAFDPLSTLPDHSEPVPVPELERGR